MALLGELITKPDVHRYAGGDESEDEARYFVFFAARHLISGAEAIAERRRDDDDDFDAICELLGGFNAAMKRGEDAINRTRPKETPRIGIEELRKLVGDAGHAKVTIDVDAEGSVKRKNYTLTNRYRLVPGGLQDQEA